MGSVDFTIILSSLGGQPNRELAEQLPVVDLIIGHHGADETRIGQTTLVSARSKGTHVGRIELRGSVAARLRVGEVTQVPVGAELPVLSAVQKIIDEFYQSASALHADQDPRVAPENGLESQPNLTYAGVESCAPCHRLEYIDWSASLHAVAYATLQQRNRQFFADCVSCHTTGFGYESGFQIGDRSAVLEGVQCEVCHGPGSRHISRPLATNIRRDVGPRFCQQCHTPEMSPEFGTHDEEFVSKIDHSRTVSPADEDRPLRWASSTDPVTLDLFVMSLCPYGMRAESLLLPLVDQLKDHLRLNLHFIADLAAEPAVHSERVSSIGSPSTKRQGCEKSTSSGDGPFLSLHGTERDRREPPPARIAVGGSGEFYPLTCFVAAVRGQRGIGLHVPTRSASTEKRWIRQPTGPRESGFFGKTSVWRINWVYMFLPRFISTEREYEGEPRTDEPAAIPLRGGRRRVPFASRSPSAAPMPIAPTDRDLLLSVATQTPQMLNANTWNRPISPSRCSNSDACRQCDTGDFLRSTMNLFPQVV